MLEWITQTIEHYAKEQTVTGDDATREYARWLEDLSPADFKATGNILFRVSKAARKSGEWESIPHLRYCDWTFRKVYRFVQLRRPR